jgi:uncharacterized protein YlxW (UPF0749 family)
MSGDDPRPEGETEEPTEPPRVMVPVDESSEEPGEERVPEPTDEPDRAAAGARMGEPADEPGPGPVGELADEPGPGPVGGLADEPVREPGEEPGERPGEEAGDPGEADGGAEGRQSDWVLPPVADVEERAAPRTGRTAAGWLVGLLLALLGFGIAVQVRSNTSTSGLPAARQEDLVRILDDISSREERLRRQIADLEAARTRLSTAGDRSSTALEEARTRSTALGILTGTIPAQGPGIELTITDPRRRFAAEDLLDAVEELRAAGAEAIQVGGVRVGLETAFVGTDRGIAVDGTPLTAPYTLVAIGEPGTLATALDIPGGVTDTARRAGGDARVQQRDTVVIRAVRTPRAPRYSRPAE